MKLYPQTARALFKLGAIDPQAPWPDYLAAGIGPGDIPGLIEAVRRRPFYRGEPGPAGYIPIHAWRALAQLRAVEACGVMIEALREEAEADPGSGWTLEEMPEVFEMIGPGALPTLAAALQDGSLDPNSRWAVAEGISRVGTTHPETRAECVALLAECLGRSAENEADLNEGLVIGLKTLKAAEAAGVIERAYAAGHLSGWAAGKWESVKRELGVVTPT